MTRSILNKIIFATILLIAFVVRTAQLGQVPAGFFCDEASIGVNAYSILSRGSDQYGVFLPTFFQAFGEFKGPVQIYSTIPFIAFAGLSEWSVRMASVVWGLLSVAAIYFTTSEILRDSRHRNTCALFAMTMLAVSPWHIHFSRVSLEGITPYLFFVLTGLYFFLRSQRQAILLIFSAFMFVLACYSYFPSRIFTPLFCFGIALIYLKHLITNWKITLISFATACILLVPFAYHLFGQGGLSRWSQVSIFSHPPKDKQITLHITQNYSRHFGLDYLFKKGDIDMPGQFITRHSVRGIGELYWFQLPLLILGLIYLLWLRNWRIFLVLTLWLIIYPVGSMFTVDASPQATRSFIGVGILSILTGIGVAPILVISSRRKLFSATLWIFLIIVMAGSFYNYVRIYFYEYSKYSEDFWGWQYGPKNIVKSLSSMSSDYDELYMSPAFNEPYIFIKFYNPNGCNNCRIGLPDNQYVSGKKQLFTLTPDYISAHQEFSYKIIKNIYYTSGDIAFVLVEVKEKII